MKKNYSTIILIITILICILSIVINLKIKRKFIDDRISGLKSELFNCEYNLTQNDEKFTQCISSENLKLSNLKLFDRNYDSISLKKLISGKKLVYRFYSSSCVQCIEEELDIVNQLADSIGVNNIIIISDYENINILTAIAVRKNIKSPFFIYRKKFELPIEFDPSSIPSFFVLDTMLRTKFVFKTGGHQKISGPYYKRIISYLRNGY